MKEAAGEANMTVITIVLIGLVAAAGAILVPQLLNRGNDQTDCTSKGNVWYNGACYTPNRCSKAANGAYTCQ